MASLRKHIIPIIIGGFTPSLPPQRGASTTAIPWEETQRYKSLRGFRYTLFEGSICLRLDMSEDMRGLYHIESPRSGDISNPPKGIYRKTRAKSARVLYRPFLYQFPSTFSVATLDSAEPPRPFTAHLYW